MKRSRVVVLVFGVILSFGLTAGIAILASFLTSGEFHPASVIVWMLFASLLSGAPLTVVFDDIEDRKVALFVQTVAVVILTIIPLSAVLYVHHGMSDWTLAEKVRGDVRGWGMAFGIVYGFAATKLSGCLKTWTGNNCTE